MMFLNYHLWFRLVLAFQSTINIATLDLLTEFAAANVLEFVKEKLAPHIYNAAVNDVKNVVEQQYYAIDEEILSLERPLKK